MKLLTAEQIRKLDQATIEKGSIASIDLMEQAATRCVDWMWLNCHRRKFSVVCGTGNNGGDGLAIARQLIRRECDVEIYILGDVSSGSPDFQSNYERLQSLEDVHIYPLDEENHLLSIAAERVIVDALFGTGLSRPIDGWRSEVVKAINTLPNLVIAVDCPSGLFAEQWEETSKPAIQADFTLSFQMPKLSFLFSENERFTGKVVVLNIGLDEDTRANFNSPFHLTTEADCRTIQKSHPNFSHKGNRGRLQIFAGSKGSAGAALLCTRGALRSGVGLVFTHTPADVLQIIQQGAPEAQTTEDGKSHLTDLNPHDKIDATALGPGFGTDAQTVEALSRWLGQNMNPAVIDADALNILAQSAEGIDLLQGEYIITPHAREFDRLFGEHSNSFDRFRTMQLKAQEHHLVIVLKGAFTRVALPDGSVHFNNSGNAGMAKGGSGDVLTGLIGGLLAQGYSAETAARLGVYIHGAAGDRAAKQFGQAGMKSGDLVDALGEVWRKIESGKE